MIKLINVIKKYDDFILKLPEMRIERGSILGFIGPNGAGKSTTINIICGLVKPDSGFVYINDLNIESEKIKILRMLGVSAEKSEPYQSLTSIEYLEFSGRMYDMSETDIKKKINYYLEYFNLQKKTKLPIAGLSAGEKKKIIFIAALLHSPSILLLDESFNGFDIETVSSALALLEEFKLNGGCILLSSHILSHIEKICTHFAFITNGNIRYYAAAAELINAFPDKSMEQIYKCIQEKSLM